MKRCRQMSSSPRGKLRLRWETFFGRMQEIRLLKDKSRTKLDKKLSLWRFCGIFHFFSVRGGPTRVRGIPTGVRGIPTGVRGIPTGVRGIPTGVRGIPTGVRGIPTGVRGIPTGVRGIPRRGDVALWDNSLRACPRIEKEKRKELRRRGGGQVVPPRELEMMTARTTAEMTA